MRAKRLRDLTGSFCTKRNVRTGRQNVYCWRKEYGGLDLDQARRMKDLEKENVRLKRLGGRTVA
jgi:hypothetical protein